jgi:uncharacterized membrane protein YphA (DoxX/SURF4 family)
MTRRIGLRNLPGRFATGAYIAHTGWEKWHGTPELADGVHGMAAGAFPVLRPIPPTTFLKLLAAGELTTGALLLSPLASNLTAGLTLSGFSGALLTMYARTPAMHKPGSIWPTPAGMAVSKDVWMFGIGLGLLADALTSSATSRRRRR